MQSSRGCGVWREIAPENTLFVHRRFPMSPNTQTLSRSSFRRGASVQPEIIGADDRILNTDTTAVPFRFVCCIDRFFVTTAPDEPRRTTGVLISPRHVLTVGHTVLSPSFGAVSRMN